MKAAAVSYTRPAHLTDVLQLLAEHGDEARLLAGGQTLLATLNMRLSEPALLIDLQSVAELKGLSITGNVLRIGALVTHTEIENSPIVALRAPLLAASAPHIAHRAIRNLGTFGGSIAYGDPAAEWPACLLAMNGVVVARSLKGTRRIPVDEFFTGLYTTALATDEIIESCEMELAPQGDATRRFSFTELARRHGDYAVVGLAATATVHQQVIRDIRLAWIGVGSAPMRSRGCEKVLLSQPLNEQTVATAVTALRSELSPLADLTHSEDAKKQLACVLLKRALQGWMTPAQTSTDAVSATV
jgi:aerobic carbon-monoxide dehydrogenase medium subunit